MRRATVVIVATMSPLWIAGRTCINATTVVGDLIILSHVSTGKSTMAKKHRAKRTDTEARPKLHAPTTKQSSSTKHPPAKEQRRSDAAATASKAVEDILGRSDQVGSILTKSLDLAEAGISLGLNLLNRMGSMAQDSLIERLTSPLGLSAQPNAPGQDSTRKDSPRADGPGAAQQQPDPGSNTVYVTNRLPVLPGHGCKISFSINNDSYTEPKKVKLHCEGFSGERTSTKFDGKAFSVHPAAKVIEAMDFEKFTLAGNVPATLPSDVYCGWVVVNSDNELRIPVRLVVSDSM
jgi:hypothetical protein